MSVKTVVQAVCFNFSNERAVGVTESTADFESLRTCERATRAGAIVFSRVYAVGCGDEIHSVDDLCSKVVTEFSDNESFRRGFNFFSVKPYGADRADVVSVKTVV